MKVCTNTNFEGRFKNSILLLIFHTFLVCFLLPLYFLFFTLTYIIIDKTNTKWCSKQMEEYIVITTTWNSFILKIPSCKSAWLFEQNPLRYIMHTIFLVHMKIEILTIPLNLHTYFPMIHGNLFPTTESRAHTDPVA